MASKCAAILLLASLFIAGTCADEAPKGECTASDVEACASMEVQSGFEDFKDAEGNKLLQNMVVSRKAMASAPNQAAKEKAAAKANAVKGKKVAEIQAAEAKAAANKAYNCESVTVKVTTKDWGSEIRWKVDGGEEYGPFSDHQVSTQELCLPPGGHTLEYMDTYGDGWHGGTIEIEGSASMSPKTVEPHHGQEWQSASFLIGGFCTRLEAAGYSCEATGCRSCCMGFAGDPTIWEGTSSETHVCDFLGGGNIRNVYDLFQFGCTSCLDNVDKNYDLLQQCVADACVSVSSSPSGASALAESRVNDSFGSSLLETSSGSNEAMDSSLERKSNVC